MNTSSPSVDHDIDVYAWTSHNAELLREGRLSEIDRMNIAEELNSMGRSIKRELGSRLRVLLAHLLKWRYQPNRRGNSWRLTIRNQRTEIRELLEESPSLITGIESYFLKQYQEARVLAAIETELSVDAFPVDCPFALDETLNPEFWPE